MSEVSPPEPPRPRVRFEPIRFGVAAGGARVALYGAIVVVMVTLAGYMILIEGHPLASPYAIGPAIGALWFALRLFMILSSRK
ncbi:MAG TPA: hypothetical protein DHW63_10555 [Hyphomonadaceae bacterium]|nr:hypothetical protein [Hyphomonadaceae bacterium]